MVIPSFDFMVSWPGSRFHLILDGKLAVYSAWATLGVALGHKGSLPVRHSSASMSSSLGNQSTANGKYSHIPKLYCVSCDLVWKRCRAVVALWRLSVYFSGDKLLEVQLQSSWFPCLPVKALRTKRDLNFFSRLNSLMPVFS